MADWHKEQATFTELDETIVVGRPAFVAYFYSHEGLENHAETLFAAWLDLMSPETSLYYSHDNTRRILKLTPKARRKISGELSAENIAKTEEYKYYYAKSGPADGPIDECHGYSFEIKITSGENGYVFVAFPFQYTAQLGADAVVAWFKDWCGSFQFTHAGAGFGYEIAWFDEQTSMAYPLMLRTALRFHGVRMFDRNTAQFREQGIQTLDTAAWLTFLDKETIDNLEPDSIDDIDPGVTRHAISDGIVLQAGPEPDACDTNRPSRAHALLRSVNAAIVPVRTTAWWKNWFAANDPDRENGWFERMD